jgi:hypothetical protein
MSRSGKVCTLELFTPKRLEALRPIREDEVTAMVESIFKDCTNPGTTLFSFSFFPFFFLLILFFVLDYFPFFLKKILLIFSWVLLDKSVLLFYYGDNLCTKSTFLIPRNGGGTPCIVACECGGETRSVASCTCLGKKNKIYLFISLQDNNR